MKMTVGVDTAMVPEFELEYMSVNGYSGKLYGKSELSIYAPDGREIMHTSVRPINTAEELRVIVDQMPDLIRKMLSVHSEEKT